MICNLYRKERYCYSDEKSVTWKFWDRVRNNYLRICISSRSVLLYLGKEKRFGFSWLMASGASFGGSQITVSVHWLKLSCCAQFEGKKPVNLMQQSDAMRLRNIFLFGQQNRTIEWSLIIIIRHLENRMNQCGHKTKFSAQISPCIVCRLTK